MRKNIFGRYLAICFAAGVLTGCESGQHGWEEPAGQEQEVTFRADFEDISETRVSGTSWEPGDMIGVFMFDFSTNKVVAANKRYHTLTSGGIFNAFEPSDRIVIPSTEGISFFACYPYLTQYASAEKDYVFNLDISDQSDQKRLDVMRGEVEEGSSLISPKLVFRRCLAKLVIDVAAGYGVPSLEGLKVTVSGVPVTATYNAINGLVLPDDGRGAVDAKVTVSGTTARVEITLIPDNEARPEVKFRLAGGVYGSVRFTMPGEGVCSTMRVTLRDPDNSTSQTYKYFETPVVPSHGLGTELLYTETKLPGRTHMRNYQMLFDTSGRVAQWVAYPMHPTYLGNTNRTDNWGYDPNVPRDKQANLSGGWGGSGYDRGHQMPSADRTYSAAENTTTFYYTNMTPQNSSMNQGIWNVLEGRVRTWMGQCDTLYVVTGAVLPPVGQRQYLKDRSGNDIVVPRYYYKALAKRTNSTNTFVTAAFMIDNRAIGHTRWSDFRIPVSELEQSTGIIFFPGLPDPSVKNTVDASKWL